MYNFFVEKFLLFYNLKLTILEKKIIKNCEFVKIDHNKKNIFFEIILIIIIYVTIRLYLVIVDISAIIKLVFGLIFYQLIIIEIFFYFDLLNFLIFLKD